MCAVMQKMKETCLPSHMLHWACKSSSFRSRKSRVKSRLQNLLEGLLYACSGKDYWCSGRMKNHTLTFVLLASLMTAHQCFDIPFEVTTQSASIKEGSCIELTLTSKRDLPGPPANWFWTKDSNWSESQNKFVGPVIFSSNTNVWPIQPQFVGRVQSQGSPPSQWHTGTSMMALMCNISKSDNGTYSFFYQLTEGSPWEEVSALVNVEDNPCLIHFVQPPTMTKAIEMLYCSYHTDACPVKLQLLDNNLPIRLRRISTGKMIAAEVVNNWQNDGKKVACQAAGNTDKYLRKYVTLDIPYPPTVEISTSKTTLKKGESLILSCDVKKGNPWPNTFTWYKDDKPIITEKYYLHIESPVLPEHKGLYKCVANHTAYKGMSVTSAPLFIDVQHRPRNTSVSIVGSAKNEVKAGASVVLRCTTDANPEPYEYAWMLFSQDERLSQRLPDNAEHLLLPEVRPSNRMCYRCSTTNALDEGDVSERLCIKILHAPTNVRLSMLGKVPEGEMVSVACSAESVPLSRLTLTRTVGSVTTILGETAQNDVLSYIFKATWTDGGVYTCEATNAEGRGSAQKTLEVTYAPRNVAVKANPSLEVAKNTMLTLQCDADSNPPITSVTWWKEDSVHQNEADQQALIMTHVTPDHAGIYGCMAANQLGSARSPPVKVEVHSGLPEPVLSMAAKVTEGDLVSMLCSVESDLLSILTLTRVSGKLSSEWPGASSHGNAVGPNSTLAHTFKATADDSGVYICEADNGFGKRRAQKTLRVSYAPKHVTATAQSSLMVAENGTLVLRCDADSDPPVESVMWWKVNDARPQNLPPGQNLTVASFAAADAGLYGCTATNEVGSASSPPVEVEMQNLNKLMEITNAFNTVWLLKYIVAPLCIFLILVFVLFFLWRVKRRSKKVSLVTVDNAQTRELNPDNTYSMSNLSSDGKTRSKDASDEDSKVYQSYAEVQLEQPNQTCEWADNRSEGDTYMGFII
ncbi:B-cell receptor CD22-like isoform X2 [Festucalex cinctus]